MRRLKKFRNDEIFKLKGIVEKVVTVFLNDVAVIDCSKGEILLNDTSTPALGALGNDWEEFCLKPGINQIGVSYSDWIEPAYAPKFKMRYREVFI